MFKVRRQGRGVTSKNGLDLWDEKYTASDPRSRYLGKDRNNIVKVNKKEKVKNMTKGLRKKIKKVFKK